MRFRLRSLLIVVALFSLLFGLATILRPPYENYTAQRFQAWLEERTGIRLYPSARGGDYTGDLKVWADDGNIGEGHLLNGEWHGPLREYFPDGSIEREYEYIDGQRHGIWIDYHTDGSINWIREYRMGEPWNGICHIYDGKAWFGGYRDGQKWNGCFRDPIDSDDPSGEYYVDGKRVGRNDFIEQHGIETREPGYLFGHDVFENDDNVAIHRAAD